MSISSISNSAVPTYQVLNPNSPVTQANTAAQDSDGDNDGSRGVQGPSGHSKGSHALLSSILQTLGQMGIGPSGQANSNPQTAQANQNVGGDGSSGGAGSAVSGNVRQDIHAFMHALFQTLQASGAGGASPNPNSSTTDSDGDNDQSSAQVSSSQGAAAYGKLASGLDSLLQSLSGSVGSSASAGGNLTNLQNAFQTLVNDLGGASNTGAGSNATPAAASGGSQTSSLQSFLQSLAQNLQVPGNGPLEPLGNNVNKLV